MTTAFPSGLDAFTNPKASDGLASPDHAGQHANANDAISALEAKVGIDSSAVTTSLEHRLSTAESSIAGVLAGPVSSITRDGNNRVTGLTEGSNVYSSITRDGTTGLVTSFVLNGTTHTVARDGSNRITGVS